MFNMNSPIVNNLIQNCQLPPQMVQGNMYYGTTPTINQYQPQYYQPQQQGSFFDNPPVVENYQNPATVNFQHTMNLYNGPTEDDEFDNQTNYQPQYYQQYPQQQYSQPMISPIYTQNNPQYQNPYNPYMNPNYNSAFYGGAFANYSNPYMDRIMQERREREERALMEQQRAFRVEEAKIYKKLSMACNAYRGYDIENMEEHLKQYDPPELPDFNKKPKLIKVCLEFYDDNGNVTKVQKCWKDYERTALTERQEDALTQHLIEAAPYMIEGNVFALAKIQRHNQIFEAEKQKHPDNIGIVEYFNEHAGELLREAKVAECQKYMEQQMLKRDRNFSEIINFGKNYRTLLQQSFGDPEVTGITVTDKGGLSITPPANIMSNYEKRKAEFLNSIKAVR